MCPEKQLLSVYFDGELPERFARKLEEHVASCDLCKKTLAAFGSLSRKLKTADAGGAFGPAAESGDACLAAASRVWAKLPLENAEQESGTLAGGAQRRAVSRRKFPARGLWRRSISVPAPLALAATLLVVFSLGLLLYQLSPARQNSSGNMMARGSGGDIISERIEPESMTAVPAGNPADMAEVLQYLQNNNADVVNMRLPGQRNFKRSGMPVLVSSSDYAGGKIR